MRFLVVDDDFACRRLMYKFLLNYGEVDITIDGMEAVDAFNMALDEGKPYDAVFLDVMMPNLDGKKTLKMIRDIETVRAVDSEQKVKIIMTTALNDITTVDQTFELGCEAYAAKPIDTDKLLTVMKKLGLI
jgi:two-component system, chemotaxis family, chemotaxis protein CheY